MGYTHYWTQTRDFTPEEMGDIAASVRRIINEASGKLYPNNYDGSGDVVLEIFGAYGTGEPKLAKECISFNGDDRRGLDHETFYFAAERTEPYPGGERGWAFCKTAQKPYDIVVTACLTFLMTDYGFEVSSDGDHDDWEAGVALAERALGRQFANPMAVDALVG
jgi:hypothetical protein